jgi:hypothetical protein
MELGPACDEPPWLDEARWAVDPCRCWDPGFGCEQLSDTCKRGVEARIARGRWLILQERDLAGAGGAPEVVGKPEQQAQRIQLLALLQPDS